MILNHYNNLIFASPSLVEVKSSIKELFSPKLLDGLKGLSLRPWKRRSLWWKTLGLKIQKYCKKGPDIVILLLPLCIWFLIVWFTWNKEKKPGLRQVEQGFSVFFVNCQKFCWHIWRFFKVLQVHYFALSKYFKKFDKIATMFNLY